MVQSNSLALCWPLVQAECSSEFQIEEQAHRHVDKGGTKAKTIASFIHILSVE